VFGRERRKTHEKHGDREIADVGARNDTPALDIRCDPRLWRSRDLKKDLFLAAEAANLSLTRSRESVPHTQREGVLDLLKWIA